MKSHMLFSLAACAVVCLLVASASAQAQVPEITAAQASRILSAYIQAPDTTLAAIPIPDIEVNGHTCYLFYGDHGGRYRIDAATLEKGIHYAGLSATDQNGEMPAGYLTAAQLKPIAVAYVAQYFPGYSLGMFEVSAPVIDLSTDADEYYVSFDCMAASGAEQPIHCLVILEEDTGLVKAYDETSIPVTVSTVPSLTAAQALQAGRNWITQNVSVDPLSGQLRADAARPGVRFYVAVDGLLNEALVYQIAYNCLSLLIDAQTGAVIGADGYSGVTLGLRAGPKRTGKVREVLWNVKARATDDKELSRAAVEMQDQIYLWSGYLKSLGIRAMPAGNRLWLSKGERVIQVPIRDYASATGKDAWHRKDGYYLPIAVVQRLAAGVRKRSDAHLIDLNVRPMSRVAKEQNLAPINP